MKLLRYNGLSIVLLALFLGAWFGQAWAGRAVYNSEEQDHGFPPAGRIAYLGTSHFWQATAENWESEFLQMGMFVILTKHLYQKGSGESKDPDGSASVDDDPRGHASDPDAPWPVKRGGWVLWCYERSLSATFFAIFLASITLHLVAGKAEFVRSETLQNKPEPGYAEYVGGGTFWFESMQNWQSEFLSILAMVVGTVFLRERCSSESKPVATPTAENA